MVLSESHNFISLISLTYKIRVTYFPKGLIRILYKITSAFPGMEYYYFETLPEYVGEDLDIVGVDAFVISSIVPITYPLTTHSHPNNHILQ